MVRPGYLRVPLPRWERMFRFVVCTAGILLSLYAFYLEREKAHDIHYQALCDLSEQLRCSAALTSRWGRGLGLVDFIFGKDSAINKSNSVFGLVFYTLQMLLGITASAIASLILIMSSIVSLAASLHLACILHFILKEFCILHVIAYLLNLILFIINYKRLIYLVEAWDQLLQPKQE
ncbi:vitamin K epoxide reductase complex subunit 1-like protein 1 [Vidua macroura]|uniref:vitamin K epoxide reductase complex subunit 1-like protein 1 n=1 Tax=Vidua macroura TaxID=187451 RepID=UPI0023A7AA89|nr:vitamin K epoxide reductase complex subunit 1-like protein 1 [Vidua macroura]